MPVDSPHPRQDISPTASAGNSASPASEAAVAPFKSLPESPLVVIRAGKRRAPLDLDDIWKYKDVLYFLTWRDIKLRYKQTALGVAWAVMQPLFTMLIFTLFFGKLARVPSDGIPYPIFAYAGLMPWSFVANAITASGNSLIGSSYLITKVYFPRVIIPAAAIAAGLMDFAIAFILIFFMMAFYGFPLSSGSLLLPFLVLFTFLLTLAVGMWLAALNVKYRDVRHALPFLIQLWMFVTPIIYPVSMVPPKWRWVMLLNPLAALIEGYRAALFGKPLDWTALGISALIILMLLTYSGYVFRRMQRFFADII